MPESILQFDGISKSFFGVRALEDVSLLVASRGICWA